MTDKPEVVYALKSFRDSSKKTYSIGAPIPTDDMSEKTLKHYLAHGMVGVDEPEVVTPRAADSSGGGEDLAGEEDKAADSPEETKPAAPEETKSEGTKKKK